MIRKFLFCIFSFILLLSELHADPTVLLIKMPTRSRPDKFFQTLNLYYKNISWEIPFHFVITCDLDDATMNNPEVMQKIAKYPNLSIYYGNSKSKIEACNADIEKHLDFQIIMLVSDDMIPVANNFDQIIVERMTKHFPDLDGILHFNDGYVRNHLNTLPILGKNWYDKFGYIYYPEYNSFFCDNEMTDVAKILGKSVYFEDVLIEHRHPANNHKYKYDELYLSCYKDWDHDKALYFERLERNFDLNESSNENNLSHSNASSLESPSSTYFID